jgi:outer membrane receptor protein involved in Fe transport
LRRNNFAYFAENRWNFQQRLFLTVGVRVEDFRTSEILPIPYSHDQVFPATSIVSANPRASVAYFIRPQSSDGGWDYAKVHGSFGTGIRVPNGFELAFTSNPKLRPERTVSFDAGVETSWWRSRALFDVTYFDNRFRDQIVTLGGDLRNLSTFSSDNLGNSRARGVELTATLQPTAALRVTGQYTFLDSEILSLDGAPGRAQSVFAVGDPLIRRPRHSGSVLAAWSHRRLILSLEALLRSSVRDIDPNLGTYACQLGMPCFFRNPGYVNANVGVSYEFMNGLAWYAKVNNVLNQKYEEVLGYPAYKLNFDLGVRVTIGGERGMHWKR